MTENTMRTDYLVLIIEWYIAHSYDWKIRTNKHGRFFKKHLSPQLWQKIEATFASADIEDNWRALFSYTDLGNELGTTLAKKLDYPYLSLLEKDIREYLKTIRNNSKILDK